MKFLSVTISIFFFSSSFSQYYYNDIIANNQSNRQYQLLKSNKIKKVTINSFDADNQPLQGLSLTQEFAPDYSELSTIDSSSTLNTFYENNKVKRTSTTVKDIETITDYSYDDKGRLHSISSTSTDTALKSDAAEKHIWEYNSNDHPDYMLKIKNNTDTTRIELICDPQGNVIEEHWKKNNLSLETYYYYYNDKNLLTDIVRFNKRAQKLLPDFLFEYDANNRVSQMIQVPAGNSNYLVWHYSYNENGLKQQEICDDKQKQVVGKVVYSYLQN